MCLFLTVMAGEDDVERGPNSQNTPVERSISSEETRQDQTPITHSHHAHEQGVDEKHDPAFDVALNHDELPLSLSLAKKWIAVSILCSSATCVTCASSMVRFICNQYVLSRDHSH